MSRGFTPPGATPAGATPAGGADGTFSGARSFPANLPKRALFHLDLRRSLEMHRRLAMGMALLGVVLAAVYFFRNWPIYTAKALVYIQPAPAAVLDGGVALHWPYDYDPASYEPYIQQQILSMTRDDVLRDALGRLGSSGWQRSGESEQDAIDRLKGSIEASREQNSYEASISAHARSAQMAADLANAVAESYIESTRHEQRAGDAERLAMLREERDRVKSELAGDRTEQAALNAQLGVAAIGAAASENYDDDIARIHDELVKARADHDQAEARLAAMDAEGGPNSAALDAAAGEAASSDAGLTSQEKLRADLERTSGVEARLNAELGQMTRAAAGATPKLQRASDLAGDIARLKNRYDALDEQLQNQMIEDAAPGTAHITAAATPPAHPVESGLIRNTVVILFGFGLLGLMAAVVAQKMDARVHSASDVERVLGLSPLAQLPDFDHVSEPVADEHILRLAAAMEHARRQGRLHTCIVTGTGPGTGTTTIANRLRAVLEGMGRPAVLVDAASYGPAAVCGPAAGSGPAAGGVSNSVSQARGTRSLVLLQRLNETAGHDQGMVLTDTAPLLVSAETEYLARNVDCAIVVMEAGVTTRAQLRATAEALQRLDVGGVGFVLNRVSPAKAGKAFRDSLAAMESHLRLQGRAGASAPQSRSIAPMPPAETPEIAEPEVRRIQAEPAAAAVPAALAPAAPAPPVFGPAALAAHSAVPAPAPARDEWSALAAPAVPLPHRKRRATDFPPAIPPQEAGPDLPWWLTDRPTAAVPAALAEPPAAPIDPVPPPAPPLIQPDEPPPASRLSGLRNLVLARGRKMEKPPVASAPAQPGERPDWEGQLQALERPREPQPEAPAAAAERILEPPLAAPEPVADLEPEPASTVFAFPDEPRAVTTPPEFLPPQAHKEPPPDQAARRDRRDTVDDVAVLPSWPGQYRRKGRS